MKGPYWSVAYSNIKQRCENPRSTGYKYYGGRGIKCRITSQILKELFIRDKAHQFRRPSVDRINPNGDYVAKNVRWIEFNDNRSRVKRVKKQRRSLWCMIRVRPSTRSEILKFASDVDRPIGGYLHRLFVVKDRALRAAIARAEGKP